MLHTILQYFSLFFPPAFARLAHWHPVFYDNIVLLDPQHVILAMLPICLFYMESFAIDNRHPHDDRDDEQPPEYLPRSFRVLCNNIRYWLWVYKALEVVAALAIVLRTPGFGAKALLAIDLAVESTLVSLAKDRFLHLYWFVCQRSI